MPLDSDTNANVSRSRPMETPQSHQNPDGPPEPLLLDDPDADIILRSCDLREFRTLKLYITRSSPVLEDLIRSSTIDSSDSSTSSRAEGLPSVQISENGDILSCLLSFILPVSPVLPPTTEQIMELLSVAQKYEMTSILTRIRETVASLDPPFILPETALNIYSLAQRYGLNQEVFRAVRMALTFPITIEDLEDKLDIMPGAYLHLLWKYYQRVRINLRLELTAFRSNGGHSSLASLTCSTATSSGIPSWLDDYIASIAEDPSLFSLTEFHMCLTRHVVTTPLSRGCETCATTPTKTICAFWKAFTAVVNDSMTKVSATYVPNNGHSWNPGASIRRKGFSRESEVARLYKFG